MHHQGVKSYELQLCAPVGGAFISFRRILNQHLSLLPLIIACICLVEKDQILVPFADLFVRAERAFGDVGLHLGTIVVPRDPLVHLLHHLTLRWFAESGAF